MTQAQHQQWLERHLTHTPNDHRSCPAGKFTGGNIQLNISATSSRERLEKGESCDDLLPENVLNYINQRGYTTVSTLRSADGDARFAQRCVSPR